MGKPRYDIIGGNWFQCNVELPKVGERGAIAHCVSGGHGWLCWSRGAWRPMTAPEVGFYRMNPPAMFRSNPHPIEFLCYECRAKVECSYRMARQNYGLYMARGGFTEGYYDETGDYCIGCGVKRYLKKTL